jgi:hypothetical protein
MSAAKLSRGFSPRQRRAQRRPRRARECYSAIVNVDRSADDTLAAVQAFAGERLTREVARRLAQAPFDQLQILIEDYLVRVYRGWGEPVAEEPAEPIYYSFLPSYGLLPTWDALVNKYKALMVYFPRVALHDPVAQALATPLGLADAYARLVIMGAPDTAGEAGGQPLGALQRLLEEQARDPARERSMDPSIYLAAGEARFRADVERALVLMADLEPLIARGAVTLVPSPFAFEAVENEARAEVAGMTDEARRAYQRLEGVDDRDVQNVKRFGAIAARLHLTPVAPFPEVERLLVLEYEHAALALRARGIDAKAAQFLHGYELPGLLPSLSMGEVVQMRDDDGLARIRAALQQIFGIVHANGATDDAAFRREFRDAADTVLPPQIERLRAEPALGELFRHGGLNLTLEGLFHSLVGRISPEALGIAAAAEAGSWLLRRCFGRASNEGRRNRRLKEFFVSLLSDA